MGATGRADRLAGLCDPAGVRSDLNMGESDSATGAATAQAGPTSQVAHPSILDPDFIYRHETDVQATWRRFGWQPTERNGECDGA